MLCSANLGYVYIHIAYLDYYFILPTRYTSASELSYCSNINTLHDGLQSMSSTPHPLPSAT